MISDMLKVHGYIMGGLLVQTPKMIFFTVGKNLNCRKRGPNSTHKNPQIQNPSEIF